jgi:hypothetical protein
VDGAGAEYAGVMKPRQARVAAMSFRCGMLARYPAIVAIWPSELNLR